MPPRHELEIERDGAELRPAALDGATLAALEAVLADQPTDVAGVRLYGVPGLRPMLGPQGAIGSLAAAVMPARPQPVRAILFDKSPATNWGLAWHQDRVIAVRERLDVRGFGPWTRKHGAHHVQPPFDILAGMVTLRVHLAPVPTTNAPLLIAPGSHRFGRIPEADYPQVVERCGVAACLAEAGDVWIYSTPILHASERAAAASRRRVLQVDYAANELPGGLRWLGV